MTAKSSAHKRARNEIALALAGGTALANPARALTPLHNRGFLPDMSPALDRSGHCAISRATADRESRAA